MQTTTLPEIDESDLKAVREFLTSFRDEERAVVQRARASLSLPGAIPVRNGIARARTRGGSKTTA